VWAKIGEKMICKWEISLFKSSETNSSQASNPDDFMRVQLKTTSGISPREAAPITLPVGPGVIIKPVHRNRAKHPFTSFLNAEAGFSARIR
jgi:hypothetical protein